MKMLCIVYMYNGEFFPQNRANRMSQYFSRRKFRKTYTADGITVDRNTSWALSTTRVIELPNFFDLENKNNLILQFLKLSNEIASCVTELLKFYDK